MAITRRYHRSSVAGVTMKDRQRTRGRSRLAAAERQAVNRGDRRTSRLPAQNREFVPQHDDLKLLQLLRPKAQNHEFQKPAKQHVAQRHEHEATYVAGYGPILRNSLIRFVFRRVGTGPDPSLCTLQGSIGDVARQK